MPETLSMIPIARIVDKAIELTSQGEFFTLEGRNIRAQSYERGDISIIYTTPFSNCEPYIGEKYYIVDIWYQNKKAFTVSYKNLHELESKRKREAQWIEVLFSL